MGNCTPALDIESLNTNTEGINEKWWVVKATYSPGKSTEIIYPSHLKTLRKLDIYLFK